MGYTYQLNEYYKIKYEEKEFPWPCKADPNRTITLFDDDILSRNDNGTYVKETEVCCTNIKIPDEDVIKFDDIITMQVM
jgi:hypothetical protein